MMRCLTMALALCAAAGCSGFHSDEPATLMYVLQPASGGAQPPAAAPAGGSLAVIMPVAVPGLNTDRIALLRADGVLDAYAGSRWPDVLPDVLQPLLIDGLRAGGHFSSVQADSGPFLADYVLQVEVRQFAAVYGAGEVPTVRVQWVASLGRRADRKLLRTFTIEQSVPAAANRMAAVMAAFNAATGAALQQLVAGSVVGGQ